MMFHVRILLQNDGVGDRKLGRRWRTDQGLTSDRWIQVIGRWVDIRLYTLAAYLMEMLPAHCSCVYIPSYRSVRAVGTG